MCGIAGILDASGAPVSEAVLLKMGDALRHRGPDGGGVWAKDAVGLAHRRLAIIDIEGGGQPMISTCGRYVIAYNGELYNYRELRSELAEYRYATLSDTEVVLAAFAQWGTAAFARFNGMFAFALYDLAERLLYLVRDGFGVKPLYYASAGKRLLFASEVKAILSVAPGLARLSAQNLDVALAWRYLPSPLTLFENIRKVRPGHWICAGPDGQTAERRFGVAGAAVWDGTEDEARERAARLMQQGIRRQLVADVPVGVLLSGGVDSALLAAHAQKEYGGAMTAFTIGFAGAGAKDEIKSAAATAAFFGMKHESHIVEAPAFFDVVEKTVAHQEEPLGTTSAVPLYLLCERIARTHKVVLSGQGVDELWGGYLRHRAEAAGKNLRPLLNLPGVGNAALRLLRGKKSRRAVESFMLADDVGRYAAARLLFSGDERKRLLTRSFPDYTAHVEMFRAETESMHPVSRMLYWDARTQLCDDLLLYTDKVSMAHGVEVRVPFLDADYAAFVESLPARFKMRRFRGKYLFRKIAADLLPPAVLKRPKLGFETPVDAWLKGKHGTEIRVPLLSPDSAIGPLFHRAELKRLLDTHAKGTADFSKEIFLLLSLELWMRHFKVSL